MFKKILVANRGEIAVRVIKGIQALGIHAVACYSEVDKGSLHVQQADSSILLGPAPSNQSYLRGDYIIEQALAQGVEAIHPGYGFLSENAGFAEAVTKAGMVFIGPSPEAIRVMGSKLDAKQAVKAYDIPMVPGVDHPVKNPKEAIKIANGIGYPVLIKASAGGGGKGMRVVESADQIEEQMTRAMSEALSSFGDESVFIEKYVSSPRHIEIQVLCDNHGNYLHLFERECSIQRRHQKVVEEAPSSILDPKLRETMGQAAVNVAKACEYRGAGTVEFLLDDKMNFFFLEMNTRLQVEHPVTEMICGIDLVKAQIEVAANLPLKIKQKDLKINGHAIELRIYAEDPENDFLPTIGSLNIYQPPTSSPEGNYTVRLDHGYAEGMEIPIYYDPMIGKLIVHAKDRLTAIKGLIETINNFEIEGVKTTLPFGKFVLQHEAFVTGKFDTHFVKNYFSTSKLAEVRKDNAELAASLAGYVYKLEQEKIRGLVAEDHTWQGHR